ncbi:hypothetical protein P3W53_25470 [Pseudomonas denitrificans (nom. rej.)]|nr:hypothetical protein [Pseudomonas denitrificans (nom. rej.)]
MTTITLPDGSIIIDDSELRPEFLARKMNADGIAVENIAAELGESLTNVQHWISEAPYEDPETYWLRIYNSGALSDDE